MVGYLYVVGSRGGCWRVRLPSPYSKVAKEISEWNEASIKETVKFTNKRVSVAKKISSNLSNTQNNDCN